VKNLLGDAVFCQAGAVEAIRRPGAQRAGGRVLGALRDVAQHREQDRADQHAPRSCAPDRRWEVRPPRAAGDVDRAAQHVEGEEKPHDPARAGEESSRNVALIG